jgi:hypothetical protein
MHDVALNATILMQAAFRINNREACAGERRRCGEGGVLENRALNLHHPFCRSC